MVSFLLFLGGFKHRDFALLSSPGTQGQAVTAERGWPASAGPATRPPWAPGAAGPRPLLLSVSFSSAATQDAVQLQEGDVRAEQEHDGGIQEDGQEHLGQSHGPLPGGLQS